MKHIKLISLIAFSSLLLISCGGKKSDLGKIIPKEAAIVIDLNTKSLLSKLSWDEIKKTNWYNQLMADSSISASSKIFLGDPSKTGIDLKSDIVFFVLKPDSSGQMVLVGNLKDSKAFAEFIKNVHANATVTKDGELNVFKTNDAVIGWNDERFAIVAGENHHRRMMNDDDSSANAIPLAPPSAENLLSICKSLFSLSKDNSFYANEKFAKLTDEEGDVHFWMNINELSKSAMKNMPPMMSMIKLDKLLEDNISTATINFQDGKITGTHKQYFGKELSDILKKGEGNFNTDMIKRLPQNAAGVMAFHFTPGNLLEVIKLTGLDGFINIMLAEKRLSLDDVVRATKGDIVFAVSNITMKTDTAKTDSVKDAMKHPFKPDATYIFSVAIGDKDAFNKLTDVAKTLGQDVTQKNFFSKTDDKYFAISNSQDAVNNYFSGTTSTPAFLDKINNHPMGGYVDIQMILRSLQPDATKDSIGKVFYDRNVAMWNNAYFSGGEYKDGGIVTTGELNLIDKNTNSLKQFNQYIDDLSKVAMEQRKKRKEAWRMDSVSNKMDSSVHNQQSGKKAK